MSFRFFDCLYHAKRLKQVGFTREQAEAQVNMLVELFSKDVVASQNLNDFVGQLPHKLRLLVYGASTDVSTFRIGRTHRSHRQKRGKPYGWGSPADTDFRNAGRNATTSAIKKFFQTKQAPLKFSAGPACK